MRCYRRHALVTTIPIALAALLGSASAEPQITFKLTKKGDTWSCTRSTTSNAARSGKQALIRIVTEPAEPFTPKFFDNDAEVRPSSVNADIYTIPAADGRKARVLTRLVVTIPKGKADVDCKDALEGGIKLIEESTGDPPKEKAAGSDVAAARWFRDRGASELAELRGEGPTKLGDDVQFLVHLPSGQPAYPFPSAATEGTEMQVFVILPTAAVHTLVLEKTSCTAPNTFRTSFGGEEEGQESRLLDLRPGFALIPVGQHFRCGAGDVSYMLKVEGQSDALSTTKLRIRPRFHLAAIAMLGWDFGRRAGYAKVPDGDMIPHIEKYRERVGIEKYVGVQWMLFGVDYENMKLYNYFLNLFAAADPASPLDDFVAGLALTPTGGISLTVGLGFHRGDVLDGVRRNDPFTGEGEIPVKASWDEPGVGLSLGVSIDSRIYDSIVKRFSK